MRRRFMNNSSQFDYSNYFTIEAIEDVSVLFNVEVKYTTNGKKWKDGKRVTAKAGQLVSIKRNTIPEEMLATQWSEGAYNLKGNIMSLLFGDDAKGKTTMLGYCLQYLFKNSNVVTVEKDFLPATTLDTYCYAGMFEGCTNLTTAPELPAITLAAHCYSRMFMSCISLITVPKLPATTLAAYCYSEMFCYCKSLTQAPELPATTLATYCYSEMFYSCNNLNYIKMLAINPTSGHLNSWVTDVSSTGTFVKNKKAIWDTTPNALGDSGVPVGWTVVNDGEESGGSEVKLISFTISALMDDYPEKTYQAEEGMTWEDFCNSKYNVDNWYLLELEEITVVMHQYGDTVLFKGTSVTALDIIVPSGLYGYYA